MTDESPAPGMPADSSPLPIAKLRAARARWELGWFWLLPFASLCVVGVLFFQAWIDRGVTITLQFPEGYGLKPGDAIRYRGITVGQVRSVVLAPDWRGIEVRAELNREATYLARVGSQFWIVRAQLDWTGLRGGETLVGANYVGVLPGRGERQFEFVGESEPPIPDVGEPGGLQIVLQADTEGGLHRGVPVVYRQIRVGTVVSVGLATDSSAVEARVHIQPAYVNLIRDNTKFWNISGLNFDGSFTGGVHLQFDSVESMVAGGVALATPDPPGKRVPTDHRFSLASGPPKDLASSLPDWGKWKPSIPVGDPRLPSGAPMPRPILVRMTYGKPWLVGTEKKVREGWALPIDQALLGPADLLSAPLNAQNPEYEAEGKKQQLPQPLDAKLKGLVRIPFPRKNSLSASRLRELTVPEQLLLIADPAGTPQQLAAARLKQSPEGWEVDKSVPLGAQWHGACAVATFDGKVVGILRVDEKSAVILPVSEK